MQFLSNIPFIQYITSAEDSEQQYGNLNMGKTHEDFMLSLAINRMQINFKSLNANETAMEFATQHTSSLFLMEAEETSWKTTVHYTESNGFLGIHEVMHVLSLEGEKLLEVKAALIHNNYEKCKFTIFPKVEFFETAYLFKLGKHGKSFTLDNDFCLEYEY
jgi:hypothetical protein